MLCKKQYSLGKLRAEGGVPASNAAHLASMGLYWGRASHVPVTCADDLYFLLPENAFEQSGYSGGTADRLLQLRFCQRDVVMSVAVREACHTRQGILLCSHTLHPTAKPVKPWLMRVSTVETFSSLWQVQLWSSASLCVIFSQYQYTLSEMHAKRIGQNKANSDGFYGMQFGGSKG